MSTTEIPNGMGFMPNCETLRQHAGLSQTELSRQADVSRDTIAKVERKHPVKIELLHKIAAVFEVKNPVRFDRSKEIRTTLAPVRVKRTIKK